MFDLSKLTHLYLLLLGSHFPDVLVRVFALVVLDQIVVTSEVLDALLTLRDFYLSTLWQTQHLLIHLERCCLHLDVPLSFHNSFLSFLDFGLKSLASIISDPLLMQRACQGILCLLLLKCKVLKAQLGHLE